jgi:uncharacterized protein (DUF2249 family)
MGILYTMRTKKSGPRGSAAEVDDELTAALVRALRALGAAGRPVQACRLAAAAHAAVRHRRPAAAERLNAVLHSLARMPPEEPPFPSREATMPDTTLDVRADPPARRHQLIFETFASLPAGSAFELVNDHDPKPLSYQLEAEQPGTFTWEYLEEGPEVWRVRIGRTAPAPAPAPAA